MVLVRKRNGEGDGREDRFFNVFGGLNAWGWGTVGIVVGLWLFKGDRYCVVSVVFGYVGL